MRLAAAILAVLLASPGAQAQDQVQDPVLTCGLEDCSVLGDPYWGLDPATADRMRAVVARFEATSWEQWIELVAVAVGQVGCYEGWPAEDMLIDPYYDAAMAKLVRNIGLAPDEAEFVEGELWSVFYVVLEELAKQGRMVSVTEYEDELIPAACAQ